LENRNGSDCCVLRKICRREKKKSKKKLVELVSCAKKNWVQMWLE